MREIENLKRVGDEYRNENAGTLAIATTHTQARYVLPAVLRDFATCIPKVKLVLHQGNPEQVAELTARGEVDVGIATEALASWPDLVTLPCYEWNRVVLVPRGHPLVKVKPLTLEAMARLPIVTYDAAFTGRSQINAAFDAAGLAPTSCWRRWTPTSSRPTCRWAWASASSRRWRSTRRATPDSSACPPRTCSRRRRPSSRCAAACSCAATSTISSPGSLPRSTGRASTPPSPARRGARRTAK